MRKALDIKMHTTTTKPLQYNAKRQHQQFIYAWAWKVGASHTACAPSPLKK